MPWESFPLSNLRHLISKIFDMGTKRALKYSPASKTPALKVRKPAAAKTYRVWLVK